MIYRPQFAEIDITDDDSNDLQDNVNFLRLCHFCGKDTYLTSQLDEITSKFAKDSFYCCFCIRNEFYTRKKKNILILSMRGIIATLYNQCYAIKEPILYIAQIQGMIDQHMRCGLMNPVFHYDEQSYLWFLDFNKIGDRPYKRVCLDDVLNTCHDIISCFNLYKNLKDFKGHKLLLKYDEAIIDFYKRRYRPEGKKLLIPSLIGCHQDGSVAARKEPRDFTPKDLRIK